MAVSALKHRLAGFSRCAVDFVFPPCCPLCGQGIVPAKPAGDTERGAIPVVCDACAAALAPISGAQCRRCSAPVGPYLDTSAGCIHCLSDVFAFERVFSLGVYVDPLRAAVLSAKHAGGAPAAAALAHILCDRVQGELERLGIDMVIPVPHHWVERVMRRHLPPLTLSRVVARRLRIPGKGDALKKVRRTPAQVSLTASERRRNLRDAFRVRRGSGVSGKRILLVDDVLTTGTTAHRATRVLKRSGADRVYVAVIARGIGDRAGT